jgi:hypothetical protein
MQVWMQVWPKMAQIDSISPFFAATWLQVGCKFGCNIGNNGAQIAAINHTV